MTPTTGLDFLAHPLAFRAGVRTVTVGDEAIVLGDGPSVRAFRQEAERATLARIDGQRTGAQIVAELTGVATSFEVVEAILALQQAEWVEVVRPPLALAVKYSGVEPSDRVESAIVATKGLEVVASGTAPELTIVVANDYLAEAVSDIAANVNGPLLLVRSCAETAWLGPLLVAGETACLECMAHRLRRNQEAQRLFGESPESSVGWLADIIVRQAQSFRSAPGEHPLRGTLRALDARTLETGTHKVTRRPQCPQCGDWSPDLKPIEIGSRTRIGDGESGFRAVEPEEVLQQHAHHVSPITGVVNGIWRVGDEDAVHVARAPHMSTRPAPDWETFLSSGRNAAGGKGTTAIQARASALGESLERYCSSWHGTELHEVATYDEMLDRDESVLHPAECMLFSETQYADRKAINARDRSFKERIPKPYDGGQIAWSKIWSLSHECWSNAPTAYVYAGAPQATWRLVGESNGNAAGASMEDAILQGFLELVERDSIALWWYNAQPRRGVDLNGIDDAYIEPLRDYFSRIGRDFWVLDLTADLGVPAFVSVSHSVHDGPDEVTMGFGAHVDPRIAVLRAIAEMNQLMPAALTEVERSDRLPDELTAEGTSFGLEVDNTPYLTPDPAQPLLRVDDMAAVEADDLGEIVRRCQLAVESAGLEMLVHDLTRPDIGLPVVKVVVPGMRHFWPRFAPGRLYDVPVKLGWRENPLTESEINQVLING